VCSEAGVNPALSRNGDASAREDKPGRLPSVGDLSSEEGRLVPIPPGTRNGRTSSSTVTGG